MSILIKGIEMPKNCAECFFHKVFPATGVGINQLYCALCGINILKLSDAQPDCPIVPVPPHGRLIDADVLEKVMSEGIAPSVKDGGFKHPFDIIRAVANAPTVLEAEEV